MENTEDTTAETTTEEVVEDKTDQEKVSDNYEKLKEANDKVEAELLRGEQLRAKIAKGGKAEAGQEQEKPADETAAEYAEKVMAGDVDGT